MSYILEALKKAQAERQLGETPTIHAPTLDAPAGQGDGALRKPLVAAFAAMGIVIAGLAVVVWRQAGAPDVPPRPQVAQPGPALPAAAAVTPAAGGVTAAPPQASLPPPASTPAPSGAPPQASAQLPLPTPVPAPQAAIPAPAKPPAPVVAPPQASTPARTPAQESPREEPVQALRDLPEPIQRAIPPVAMSGYMYSPNPADRLILIDKVLRREGDEVAPGLVLERLEPKGAVFAFRGYRYRVPY